MWILRSNDTKPVVIRVMPGRVKTIGRVGNADYVVEAAMVSRVHCRLTATLDDELHVEDLASTNGTFVNEQRVTHVRLTPGDRLRLGRLELSVERGDGEQTGKGEARAARGNK